MMKQTSSEYLLRVEYLKHNSVQFTDRQLGLLHFRLGSTYSQCT